MSDVVKAVITLFVITFISAVCLGFVHSITTEPIKLQKEKFRTEAMQELLPSGSSFKEEISIPKDAEIQNVFTAYTDDGSVAGYIIGADAQGYNGIIRVFVGINANASVHGIKVVEHNETPGLGANITNAKFTDQYKGLRNEISVTKSIPNNNEVQAVTSSTISSNAVTLAVNNALKFFVAYIGGETY